MTKLPKFVISRDGSAKGRVVSAYGSRYRMEGCSGTRFGVRWPDGKLTRICSRSVALVNDDTVKLI
jgi:hypothetical protein